MSATLRVTREGVGMELRGGTFDIALDGNNTGTIDWHQTIELPVQPGRHTLRIQARRCSSKERSFEAADSEMISFRCHGAMLWPRWLVSFFVPVLGISLKRR